MKRRILVVVVLGAAATAAAYHILRRAPQSLALTGIVSTDDVTVSAQVQGRLSRLLVNQGDAVHRGQLLALIAPQELEATTNYYSSSAKSAAAQVSAAQAALEYQKLQTNDQIRQAEAQLAAARAQLKQAQANLENSRLNFERNAGLFKQGIVAAQVYDQARTTYQADQAQVVALAKQVDAQAAAVALARANGQQVAMRESQVVANLHQLAAASAETEKARVQLGYTEIRSPIDGIVDVRAALEGEVVNPAQPIVSLINPDSLWVRIDVPETYIDRIRLGEQLEVRLPSGTTRPGTVFYRGADAAFATQRDVSRTKRDIKTFEVRLRCDNHDRALAVGMTAYVSVPLTQP